MRPGRRAGVAVIIGGALYINGVGQPQDGSEERFQCLVSRPGAIGNAAVHDGEASTGAFRFGVQVRPDLGFEDDEERGPNGSQDSTHAGGIIERTEENAIDQRRSSPFRGLAPGDCGRRQINWDERLACLQFLDEGNGGSDLTGRYCMQPNATGVRPTEALGEKSETLAEMGGITAGGEEPRGEIQNDETGKIAIGLTGKGEACA